MEGELDYIKKAPTYYCLWLFKKIKWCKYGIDHTSNGYYSAVMSMRNLFCLIKGRDEPAEAYYIMFEADIYKAELKNEQQQKTNN